MVKFCGLLPFDIGTSGTLGMVVDNRLLNAIHFKHASQRHSASCSREEGCLDELSKLRIILFEVTSIMACVSLGAFGVSTVVHCGTEIVK